MLLSIDKVLQLLGEGKSVEKIAEAASAEITDVLSLIHQARDIVDQKNPEKARKKIKLKRKVQPKTESNSNTIIEEDFLKGADLSVIPLEDTLIFFIAATEIRGAATIGIVIDDKENHQVGTLQYRENTRDLTAALASALVRCVKIGDYFRSKRIRVRFDDERLSHLLSQVTKHSDQGVMKNIEAALQISSEKNRDCAFEHLEKHQNEKAHFLTRQER